MTRKERFGDTGSGLMGAGARPSLLEAGMASLPSSFPSLASALPLSDSFLFSFTVSLPKSLATNSSLPNGSRFSNRSHSGRRHGSVGMNVENSTVPGAGCMPGTTGRDAYGSGRGGGVGSRGGGGGGGVGSRVGSLVAARLARVRFLPPTGSGITASGAAAGAGVCAPGAVCSCCTATAGGSTLTGDGAVGGGPVT